MCSFDIGSNRKEDGGAVDVCVKREFAVDVGSRGCERSGSRVSLSLSNLSLRKARDETLARGAALFSVWASRLYSTAPTSLKKNAKERERDAVWTLGAKVPGC